MSSLAVTEYVSALLISIGIIEQFTTNDHSVCAKRVRLLSILTLVWLLSDALSYTLQTPIEGFRLSYYFIHFINLISYIMSNVALIFFTRFCEAYISEKVKINKKIFIFPIVVLSVNVIVDIVYYLQGRLVVVQDGVFCLIGTAPLPVLISYIVLLFFPPIVAHHKKKEIGSRPVIILTLYAVPILVSIIILDISGHDYSVLLGSLSVIVVSRFLQNDLKQSKLNESLTLTNFFLDGYLSAYYLGLEDYSCEVYKHPGASDSSKPVISNYLEEFTGKIKQSVHPDDQEELLNLIRPEELKKLMSEQKDYSFIFRELSNETENTLRLHIIRGADAAHVAFGFEDITAEILEQKRKLFGTIPLSPEVLSRADVGIWAYESDLEGGQRVYGDEAMLRILGLPADATPETVFDVWTHGVDESAINFVTEAVARMASTHSEAQYPFHRADGRTIIVRCGGTRNPEYTKGVRLEGTFQDITKMIHFDEKEVERLKHSETALKHEQLRGEILRFLVDHDDDPIELLKNFAERLRQLINCDQVICRDLEETRIMVNSPAIEETWCVPIDYCKQCTHFDAHHPIYKNGFTEMENCQEGYMGYPVHEKCPIKSSLTRIVYCDGKPAGYLAIHYVQDYHHFTDMERSTLEEFARIISISLSRYEAKKENRELKLVREMQQKLQDALDLADSANRAKTEFLFNMSHDIRTPMNAILGYTNIALHHETDTEKIHDCLTKIKTSGGHLLNLINDILEMSRIEAGKLELVNSPLDICEALEGIEHMSQALAVTKDIDFTTEIGEIQNRYVYADELHMNQVLINLISNSVKYTLPGGSVKLRAEQISAASEKTAMYRFTVSDSGIGMSKDFQKHLFENFTRENNATVSKEEGTGLGLSIVKKITELAGGTVDVKSAKGKGTTFVVDLPMKIMDDRAIEKFVRERGVSKPVKDDAKLEGKRVLIVEDNEMNREIASEILLEAGMQTETAEDGTVAVSMFSEHDPGYYDFILMDIQMPIMDGYEATANIRKLNGGENVPIIALSANAFKEDRDKSLAAGMNAHVAKPINVSTLLAAMRRLAK